ncbi:outer membrane protein assembly factor BamE [Larsenimonas rhizosphaerae]|uniref:Outer membrane protein assembly factor BamE n=1 Tax=Larsenimonas rhizosphaerae TaxID=2944682 RepID=A0AA42CYI2_9GAMM|nr:outer membrane protein assembly factor BamE [Larsenimonas rhizosphaerae]MCM2131489.1 outer membrane protein assembly factor BamE [Larsenimonas rhizosphaerae]MCX2525185.1 outer membrane protein assembly factor BamE [Larsenimonas rhizosphaerae]
MNANDKESLRQMQKSILLVTFCCMIGVLSGCSWFGVYKRDIPQGNLITESMVQQLHPGMTKDQVTYVLGTPLLDDPMGANAWDYVYRVKESDGNVINKRVSLTFDDNVVSHIDTAGDIDASPDVNNQPPASGAAQSPGVTPLEPIPATSSEPYPRGE